METAKQQATRHILWSAIALVALLVIGASGYAWLEHMSIVDAMYMTVITISTVGFGEVQELSENGRIFTILLILGGGGVAAYAVSGVAEFFMSGEWRAHLDQQRFQRMLECLKDHTIVCGYGRVGRHVAVQLNAEGMPFVVIDPDPDRIAQIQEDGYFAIKGNAANEQYLREARIEHARGLVATASTDAENVFIVLTARELRSDLIIVARANFEDSESKLLRAGADKVILPYRITGRRMVTSLMRPDVVDFLDSIMHTRNLELLLDQVSLSPDSPLVGKTIAQSQLRTRLGITVLACRLSDGSLNTCSDTLLQPHTQLIALGTRDQLQALIELARRSGASAETLQT